MFFKTLGILKVEIEALRPLDIDVGPYRQGAHGGFRYKTGAIQFSWCENDVLAKIGFLDCEESRLRARRAYDYLMGAEACICSAHTVCSLKDFTAYMVLFLQSGLCLCRFYWETSEIYERVPSCV